MTGREVMQQAEPVADAMKVVIDAMRSDPDYAWSWHCNVAMAFFDAGGDHYIANQGAARFMRLLAGVEPAHKLPAAQQIEPQHMRNSLTQEKTASTASVFGLTRQSAAAALATETEPV